jgi:hypothetical protein
MKVISNMKDTTKAPTYITFKSTTKLPDDHPCKAANYIFEYIKKGTPHVKIVIDKDETNPRKSK